MNFPTSDQTVSARHADSPQGELPPGDDRFGRRDCVWFAAGLAALLLGFVFLAMAGRTADGLLGRISPLPIVGGFVLFSLGFRPRVDKPGIRTYS
jgi:hypothetical protein